MIRKLILSDYYYGYLHLLKQLSIINDNLLYNNFKKKWFEIANNKFHHILVIELDKKKTKDINEYNNFQVELLWRYIVDSVSNFEDIEEDDERKL